ncbi:MAG: 1-(5-phosphoribosyl)-5-[(5-phosphoribosylamino)methylideneamino] imidazole-4-carboxamide isomerase [Cyclobacteriaceae bacterium]
MIQLVPSLSVINGKTVRLSKGNYSNEKEYKSTPLDVAKQFEDHGIRRIHLIDLEGAKKGKVVNYHILEMIAGYTNLNVNFSGGVHTDGDISKAFEYGAESVTAATMAVYDPELFVAWLQSYGREKVALAADHEKMKLKVGGWQSNTKIELFEHIQYFYDRGLKYLKTTDITRDGALEGPAFDLYQKVLESYPGIYLFASGGVRNIADIEKLDALGVHGVLFGKAFYEGRITLKDLEKFVVPA